ncbi:MAG TPA: hypothetical protein VKE71_13295 [Candidatus Angelobacter sp.]|nr:hypothetical protein [Candidatus Angelobacter sp.]
MKGRTAGNTEVGESGESRNENQHFEARPPSTPVRDSLLSFWRRGALAERAGYVVGVLLMISGLIHLVILSASGGSWEGPLSLRKPATFGLAFGVVLITVVWAASFVEMGGRTRTLLLYVFTAACVIETALVSLQAWRGVPSHFNVAAPFDALVARVLAAGGAALVIVTLVLTFIAFRSNANVPISMLVAIRAGLVALLATQISGALMIARGMRLVLTGNPQAAYAHGGMLKATHEVTMLGLLLLPFLAWLMSFTKWDERRRLVLVSIATGGYFVLAGIVTVGDVAGSDPLEMPVGIVVSAVGALSLVITGVLTLVGVIRGPIGVGIQHG